MATSEQVDDLVRINTNICAINTIRRELENIYLSDEEQFSGHIEKINKLLDEMAEDEINLFDAIKAESTE